MRLFKSFQVLLLSLLLLPCFVFTPSASSFERAELLEIIQGIIEWKTADTGASAAGGVLSEGFISLAGRSAGDWYPIAQSAAGINDDYGAYLSVLSDNVSGRYNKSGGLSGSKSTEWHRIILAVSASGGTPENFGELHGQAINLVNDGIFYRKNIGSQGINGCIWGLIALDASAAVTPPDAVNTRESLISDILKKELSGGGWALSGDAADADITAMAIQALSPYYAAQESVKAAVNRALAVLSAAQQADGDYLSWGTCNSESTAQVIIALCCLGIDCRTDSRFIKGENSLLNGLMKYRLPSGGFAHSFAPDENNPLALPGAADSMAGEQAMLAAAAMLRLIEGGGSIYDFSGSTHSGAGRGLTKADIEAVFALPERLSGDNRVEVLSLLSKAYYSNNSECISRLEAAAAQLESLSEKIDGLNREIAERFCRLEALRLSDKAAVDSAVELYNSLAECDRERITARDELFRAKAKTDSLFRELVTALSLAFFCAVLVLLTVLGIRRHRYKRRHWAQELENAVGDRE